MPPTAGGNDTTPKTESPTQGTAQNNNGSATQSIRRSPQRRGKNAQPQKKASTYYNADGQLMTGKLVGATIFNDQKQQIGSISDVLLDKSGKAVTAVLSVGGFLGVGSRLVAVPFARLDIEPDRIVVPGATKVSLENLPAYNPNSG